MPRLAFLLCLAALPLAGCGDDPEPTEVRGWRTCDVEGLAGASGLTILDDTLFVCAGEGDRGVYAVPVASLRPGGRAHARALDVEIRADDEIMGRDDILVQRGFRIGDLWNAQVDFQGIAVQQPRFLFLADRAHRIVYWGKVDREIGGAFARVTIDHAFVAPGAKRENVDHADYRDTGPGIAGLFGVSDRQTEDMFLLERAHGGSGDPQHEFRVLSLDRFGGLGGGSSSMGFFVVRVPGAGPPDVEALSFFDDRFLFVRGDGRGALAPFKGFGVLRTGDLGRPTPGPDPLGHGRWKGMVHGPDGTLYLVSDGDPGRIAWRDR